jgi:hypothetical protein
MQIALGTGTNPDSCPGDTNPARSSSYLSLSLSFSFTSPFLYRISYSRTAGESFVLSGIGALIFVAFGADLGIYTHWVKVCLL